MYTELSLALGNTHAPGAFYLLQLLLADALAGRHGSVQGQQQPARSQDAFQDQVLGSESCSEEQLFTCLSWCQQGGDHKQEQITAHATAAGDVGPPIWAWATLALWGAASRDGFAIPIMLRLLTSSRHRCLPQLVPPVLHQQAPVAKGKAAGRLLADAPSFSITCRLIPITRRQARRRCHRSQRSRAAQVWSEQDEG